MITAAQVATAVAYMLGDKVTYKVTAGTGDYERRDTIVHVQMQSDPISSCVAKLPKNTHEPNRRKFKRNKRRGL